MGRVGHDDGGSRMDDSVMGCQRGRGLVDVHVWREIRGLEEGGGWRRSKVLRPANQKVSIATSPISDEGSVPLLPQQRD